MPEDRGQSLTSLLADRPSISSRPRGSRLTAPIPREPPPERGLASPPLASVPVRQEALPLEKLDAPETHSEGCSSR